MKREPAFLFYYGDWMSDPKLSLCSSSARGVWIDLICAIRDLNDDGSVTGGVANLSQLARTSVRSFKSSIRELADAQVIHVTEVKTGVLRIHQDRLGKDIKDRKSNRERKLKEREDKKKAAENAKTANENAPDKRRTKDGPREARAISDSDSDSDSDSNTVLLPPVVLHSRGAATAGIEQGEPVAAAPKVSESKMPILLPSPNGTILAIKLVQEAKCQNLSDDDQRIFYQAAAIALSGIDPYFNEAEVIITAQRAGDADKPTGFFLSAMRRLLGGKEKLKQLLNRVKLERKNP